jgi:hypothetical protein
VVEEDRKSTTSRICSTRDLGYYFSSVRLGVTAAQSRDCDIGFLADTTLFDDESNDFISDSFSISDGIEAISSCLRVGDKPCDLRMG